MDQTRPDIIAADWLVPVEGTGRAIRRGGVRVGPDGRIMAVGPIEDIRRGGDSVASYADCVLTPGLLNAHAHLDLGRIDGETSKDVAQPPPAVRQSRPLHEWVLDVMAQRQSLTADEVAAIAVAGARQSLASGVTTVIDVTPARFAWSAVQEALSAVPLRRVALMEVLGFADRGRGAWADAERLLQITDADCQVPDQASAQCVSWRLALGISPHAPYSTSPTIYQRGLALARAHGWPIMTHLSETREEIRFCQSGTGPWRELQELRYGPLLFSTLASGRASEADFALAIPGCSPVAYAARLGLLDYERTLLAHVNYLQPGDLELLARSSRERKLAGGTGPTVVYCPRTADYFGHRDHPWRRLLAAGVNVAIGADSLASAPDLSILAELRFLHLNFPDVPATELFALATGGTLPWLDTALLPGAAADLAAWQMERGTDGRAESILASVIESCSPPAGVFVGGQAATHLDP